MRMPQPFKQRRQGQHRAAEAQGRMQALIFARRTEYIFQRGKRIERGLAIAQHGWIDFADDQRQHRNRLDQAEIKHQKQDRHGERLKRLVAPQGDQTAERTGGKSGGGEDQHHLGDLRGIDAAQEHQDREQRDRADQHQERFAAGCRTACPRTIS